MLESDSNTNKFIHVLAVLNRELQISACLNLQSQNLHAEDFYREVLNALYGWHLVNANERERNATAVDLIDDFEKLVVQVTVTCDTGKVNTTLKSEKVKEYQQKGYHLKFVFAGEQRTSIKKSRAIRNEHSIEFRQAEDMLFSEDLSRRYVHLGVEQQENVLDIALRETGQSFVMKEQYVRTTLAESLQILSPKYVAGLNVHIREMDIFDAILHPAEVFSEILRLSNAAKTTLDSLTSETRVPEGVESRLAELGVTLEELLHATYEGSTITLERVTDLAFWVTWDLEDLHKDIDRHETKKRRLVSEASESLHGLLLYLHECGYEYFDKRVVLVTGDGGIGKSHYLARLCEHAVREGVPAFLFLGQSFLGSKRPLDQLADMLPDAEGGGAFLEELGRYARSHGGRAIIAVDAVNEGCQHSYWREQLQPFANEVMRHAEVLLVLSVRDACEESCIPESLVRAGSTGLVRLCGFADGDDAIMRFCDYYDVDPHMLPPLAEMYRNPLYLRLACEAIAKGGTWDKADKVGMSNLMETLFDALDGELSADNRIGYSRNRRLVRKALIAVVGCRSYQSGKAVPYDEADDAIREVVQGRCSHPENMLDFLAEEGIMSIYGPRRDARVHFVYESVGDYVAADAMLSDVRRGRDAASQLRDSPEVSDALSRGASYGVAEALAVLIPERYGMEVFEVMEPGSERAFDLFVQSIPWRGLSPIDRRCCRYVKEAIATDVDRLATFLGRIIDIIDSPTNAFNGVLLHSLLSSVGHNLRDVAWSKAILQNDGIDDVITSAWVDAESLSEESLRPVALTLCWCFATSCREVRDKATKALSCVLISRPGLAASLLEEFLGMDDDYVIERLLAAIYGAAANSDDVSAWQDAAQRAYEFVFCGEETYLNVMVRNYALCLIDVVERGTDGDATFPQASIFGTSSWYDYKPTNEEIDAYVDAAKSKYGEWSDEHKCAMRLVHSMATEYGRGTCAYGDFGRYVLGRDVDMWEKALEDETPEGMVPDGYLSNMALGEILSRWYDPSIQVALDEAEERYAVRDQRGFERITKKYQWIALYRLVARLIDNYPLQHERVVYDEEYETYEKELRRRQDEYIKQKRWDFWEFKKIGEDLGEMNPDDHVIEVIRVPYGEDDIFNELASMRDIDPTMLFESPATAAEGASRVAASIMGLSGRERQDEDTLRDALDSAHAEEWDGTRYVALRSYATMRHVSGDTSEVHLGFSAGFVAPENRGKFFAGSEGHTGSDVLARELYHVYSQEFVSGPGFRLSESFWDSERLDDRMHQIVSSAVYGGIWEQGSDYALGGEAVSLDYPCKALVDFLGLTQRECGKWFDGEGVLTCLNVRSEDGTSFLVREESLERFLADNGLQLCRNEYFDISSATDRQRIWLTSVDEGGSRGSYHLVDRQDAKKDLRRERWC